MHYCGITTKVAIVDAIFDNIVNLFYIMISTMTIYFLIVTAVLPGGILFTSIIYACKVDSHRINIIILFVRI